MSGLEATAALGLACNILQVIDVGVKTVQFARQVYRDGQLDPALKENAGTLEALSSDILSTETKATSTAKDQARPRAQDKQILDLASSCRRAARDLVEEVNFLSGHSTKAKLLATLKVVAKTAWRRKRLDKLEGKLKEAEGRLQTGLLTRIYERSERTNSGMSSLGADLRQFVDDYHQGRRDLDLRVSAEANATKRHVTDETAKSERAIKMHVTQSTGKAEASLKGHLVQRDQESTLQAKRERLLQSLKFRDMNERRNLVASSHPGTFAWVLRDGSDGEASASNDGNITWDSFVDWLRSTETTYWISGKPASGKTTLMKYLIAQPCTREFLDTWRPGAAIISHFFWRPGTRMQQSIRGLFCSLLHQLLSANTASLDGVLRDHGHLLDKDADTDWSSEDLISTLYHVMDFYPSSVVMFLDGLDEVLPQDGTVRLLEAIEELRSRYKQAGRLKLCLGSRREPLLLKGLGVFPQLRLEQVNLADLRRYGKDKLHVPSDYPVIVPPEHAYLFREIEGPLSSRDLKNWLVDELVRKAEGVFLWLCLTVTAITKALHQGEVFEDLFHRIESLPSDLHDLYKDMWARADVETPNRRKLAASYLQLALVQPPVIEDEPKHIFSFMVATTPGISARLLEGDIPKDAPASYLIRECERARRELEIVCAGILQCTRPPEHLQSHFLSTALPWHGEEYLQLIPYIGQCRVSFLHRTARDFLTDTEYGKQILEIGAFRGEFARFKAHSKGSLAHYRLFRQSQAISYTLPKSYKHSLEGHLEPVIGIFWQQLMRVEHAEDCRVKFLLLFERLFNEGRIHTSPTVPFRDMDFNLDLRSDGSIKGSSQAVVRRQNEYWSRIGQGLGSVRPNVWTRILKALESRNVDGETCSQLLVSLCSLSEWVDLSLRGTENQSQFLHERIMAMQTLLDMGASASRKGILWDALFSIECEAPILLTPIQVLVSSMWSIICRRPVSEEKARDLLNLVFLLASNGADLEDEVYFHIRATRSHEVSLGGFYRCRPYFPFKKIPSGKEPMPLAVIMACKASTLVATMTQMCGLSGHSPISALLKRHNITGGGLKDSRPVAVVALSDSGAFGWATLADIYPLPSDGGLDEVFFRLVLIAEQGIKNGMVWKKNENYIPKELAEISIPSDVRVAVDLAYKQLVSENVPVLERRVEFWRRLGQLDELLPLIVGTKGE